jgi:hypothetical protein
MVAGFFPQVFYVPEKCDRLLRQKKLWGITALPVFASRCVQVSCYALTACAMWSRGSWRGGSLVSAWYFVASLTRWYGLVVWLFCLICCFAIPYWDDTKLSPLALINPLHPWTGICHVAFVLPGCVFLCFLFVVLCFVCFGVLVLCFFVLRQCYCDSTQDYVSVLYQFTFEATQPQTAYVCYN